MLIRATDFGRLLRQLRGVICQIITKKNSTFAANRIGVWDVVQSAKRIGSLDTNILDEIPNDLDEFIEVYPNLRKIAFNGAKSQKLFDKYFIRKPHFKYFALPSTSPANASFSLEKLCEKWLGILS